MSRLSSVVFRSFLALSVIVGQTCRAEVAENYFDITKPKVDEQPPSDLIIQQSSYIIILKWNRPAPPNSELWVQVKAADGASGGEAGPLAPSPDSVPTGGTINNNNITMTAPVLVDKAELNFTITVTLTTANQARELDSESVVIRVTRR